MQDHLARGLYEAKRKLIPLAIAAVVLILLVGAAVFAVLFFTTMNSDPPSYADTSTSAAAKLDGITGSLVCVHEDCADSAESVTFLNEVVADNATFSPAPGAVLPVEKTPAAWKALAAELMAEGNYGEVSAVSISGDTVTFKWGPGTYEADFATQDSTQVLQTLVRSAPDAEETAETR